MFKTSIIILLCLVLSCVLCTTIISKSDSKNCANERVMLEAHINCIEYIKDRLKDPNSFEEQTHEECIDTSSDSGSIICSIVFNAKNSFGGYVGYEQWLFICDHNGNVKPKGVMTGNEIKNFINRANNYIN